MSVQTVSLYYREGSSDKEYHASIEPAGPRFVVNFAYGRRGSTLNTGTKTNVPVEWEGGETTRSRHTRCLRTDFFTARCYLVSPVPRDFPAGPTAACDW